MSAKTEEHIELPVTGMSCAACARTIENRLSATPGVVNASVNFATGAATIDFDVTRRLKIQGEAGSDGHTAVGVGAEWQH